MTTRDFDPVFSAALRNELEALADRAEPAPSARRPVLRRPQVWITAVTALALVLATLGVLRIGFPASSPAAPGSAIVDPLTSVTTPGANSYVARAVDVLLHVRGTGAGTHAFEVPPGVTETTVYLACTPGRRFSIARDGERITWGTCDRETGGSYGFAIAAGSHTISIRVAASTTYALLAIRTPAPTITAGAVIDPLTAIRDRHTPDALVGDTRPLLRASGTRTSEVRTFPVPAGVRRLRVFLVCSPSAAATRARIDGHQLLGCMNSVAHWFDFTPSARTIRAQVVSVAPRDWQLLVVPAPKGAEDSPENTLLPYPQDTGSAAVRARGRGVGAPGSGTYVRSTSGIELVMTCRGSGYLEVSTSDGGTSTRGTACSTSTPSRVGLGGGTEDEHSRERLTWTAIPHGDISWTLTIRDLG